jgi:MFS family permease
VTELHNGNGSTQPHPNIFGYRDFRSYLVGVGLSQVGTNGAFAAILYHVFLLTGSTLQVGIVGAVRGIAIIGLSPLAGHLGDRLDRKRLLQYSQAMSMVAGLALTVVTFLGVVAAWQLWLATAMTSVAATVDSPVRKALVPALVPRALLVRATSLINPTNQVGKLFGPSLAGLLIAAQGPALMYLFDALSYVVLIVTLSRISIPTTERKPSSGIWRSVAEGFAFVRKRPTIYQLIGLDMAASFFTAYRVVLPAIALDRLHVGATGYGFLLSAVPAGALLGGLVVFRMSRHSLQAGRVAVTTTVGYGAAAMLLGFSGAFWLAFVAAIGLGLFDAIGTTIRHAAVMIETPEELQGRVQALYSMSSRGVPALGEFNVGWLAGLMGAASAMVLGGVVPIVYAGLVFAASRTLREYRTQGPHDAPQPEGSAKERRDG